MTEMLLLHNKIRLHTNACTTEAITNCGWTVLPHSLYSPDLTPSDYHLFEPFKKKKACEDTIMPVMRHCRTLCASSGRGGRATFTRQDYRFLFRGGRRLSTKIENTFKNYYTFSYGVVKVCEIFRCPTYKQHAIKKKEALLSDCSLQFCHSPT
jgi:hypothetical protein